jgi:Transposase DDE domain
VDIHAGVIVDVEATSAHLIEENDATKTMIDSVEERFDLKPKRLIGDTAYGTAAMLNWLVDEKRIEPHVPVWDKTQRTDDTLSSSDFEWSEQRNEYRCPQGYALRSDWRIFTKPRSHITKVDTIIYKSRQSDCARCAMKSSCCQNTPIRKIRRSIHEAARDVARALANTHRYKQSRNDRKKVEVLFAHLKRILKVDRLRLRGPSGAHDVFLLAAIAQNLRRMAKRLYPSPPRPAFGVT